MSHTIIHVGDAFKDEEACLQMGGLKKCSIVPPRRILHQVDPYRSNNKLLLCLCRSCVFVRNNSGECSHLRDNDRVLTGTWVLDEIRLKVEKVKKSSTFLRCTNIKLPNTVVKQRRRAIRRLYKQFLKLKAELSGYPTLVRTPEEEERYIHSFRECVRNWTRQGIDQI